VQVLTAPDNGLNQFTPLAVVTTAPNGFWTAPLPAGPSRLVIAAYHGGALTEPDFSGLVRVVVPARVRLISVTRRVPWGGTVRIVGQLDGVYLPPGGAGASADRAGLTSLHLRGARARRGQWRV